METFLQRQQNTKISHIGELLTKTEKWKYLPERKISLLVIPGHVSSVGVPRV